MLQYYYLTSYNNSETSIINRYGWWRTECVRCYMTTAAWQNEEHAWTVSIKSNKQVTPTNRIKVSTYCTSDRNLHEQGITRLHTLLQNEDSRRQNTHNCNLSTRHNMNKAVVVSSLSPLASRMMQNTSELTWHIYSGTGILRLLNYIDHRRPTEGVDPTMTRGK